MTPKFSAMLVQDVMDTLFARRVSGELFSADDEKVLAHAIRRGGTRHLERSRASSIGTSLPIATQRVSSELPPNPPPLKKQQPISPVNSALSSIHTIATIIRTYPFQAITQGKCAFIGLKVFCLHSLFCVIQPIRSFLCLIALMCLKGLHYVAIALPQLFFKRIKQMATSIKRGQRYHSLNRLRHQKRVLASKAFRLTESLDNAETDVFNALPTHQEERAPMSAVPSSSSSYALAVLPTVAQKPELTVFVTETLPATLIETTQIAEPSVTPLMSDAAVRTLMAHHPKPESLAPHSETDRLLHHNRFLASSINNLAERYFSLQQQQ